MDAHLLGIHMDYRIRFVDRLVVDGLTRAGHIDHIDRIIYINPHLSDASVAQACRDLSLHLAQRQHGIPVQTGLHWM